MDNSTAEFSFIASFFFVEPLEPPPSSKDADTGQLSHILTESQYRKEVDDHDYATDSEAMTPVPNPSVEPQGVSRLSTMDKTERTELTNIWKKIFDPVLEYTKAGRPCHTGDTNLRQFLPRPF